MLGPVMIWSRESPSTSESLGTKGASRLCSTTGWRPPTARVSRPRGIGGDGGRLRVGLCRGVAPADDADAALARHLGSAVAELRGCGGEGGDHVHHRHGAGYLLKLGRRLLDGGPYLREDLTL